MVSSRAFQKIERENRPPIDKQASVALEQANGTPLTTMGTSSVEMKLGTSIIHMEVIIADIKDDVLVGMDIGDEVDILTSQGKVFIDGHEVPCTHIRRANAFQATATDNTESAQRLSEI